MAKKNFQHDESGLPETSPEVFKLLEIQAHKIVFLNEQKQIVQEERHLAEQIAVDFDKENMSHLFDDMKKVSKEPLLILLGQQIIQESNIYKNLSREAIGP